MNRSGAYTLVELLVVVAIAGILAMVAIPRLQFGAIHRSKGEAAAWKIVTDLRRTRNLAITDAATNPDGYALNIQTSGGSSSYEIVDLGTLNVVDSHTLDSSIVHTGQQSLKFNSLGALESGSDRSVTLSASDKTFTITVVPATGTVKWVAESSGTSKTKSTSTSSREVSTNAVRPVPASPFF